MRTRHKFREIRSFLHQKVRTSASEELPLSAKCPHWTNSLPLTDCGSLLWTAPNRNNQTLYKFEINFVQDGKSIIHPIYTDEFNMKSSSRANSFSATTRVREVPVSSIYKKEIQEFRSRTPSARGVRASALTNRSIIASQTAM